MPDSETTPTKILITTEEFQGLDWPPYCNARRKQQSASMKTEHPRGSIWPSLTLVGRFRFSFSMPRIFRNKKSSIRTTGPIGIFLFANNLVEGNRADSRLTSENTISK